MLKVEKEVFLFQLVNMKLLSFFQKVAVLFALLGEISIRTIQISSPYNLANVSIFPIFMIDVLIKWLRKWWLAT